MISKFISKSRSIQNQKADYSGPSIVNFCAIYHKPSRRSMLGCPTMDDLIGTESGYSTRSNGDEVDEAKPLNSPTTTRVRSRNRVARRQYSPPMGRNPWVLRREYCEGRLIVRAEHHQLLVAHREYGRLVMVLVVAREELKVDDVEVDDDGEEGTEVPCDELDDESRPCQCGVPYGSCVATELEVPMGSWAGQDSPHLRPTRTVM